MLVPLSIAILYQAPTLRRLIRPVKDTAIEAFLADTHYSLLRGKIRIVLTVTQNDPIDESHITETTESYPKIPVIMAVETFVK